MSSEVPAYGPRIDEAATREAGGVVLPSGNGIRVGGWEISTAKGPIDGERATAAFRSALGDDGDVADNSNDDNDDDNNDDIKGKNKRRVPALPEQLYGSSFVEATHLATGIKISFTALGALRSWMRADLQREEDKKKEKEEEEEEGGGATPTAPTTSSSPSTAAAAPPPPPRPPKVPAAEKWRAARAKEIAEHGAPELEYDWTFTCPYGGDVEATTVSRSEEEEEEQGKGGGNGKGKKTPIASWKPTADRLDRGALSARDPLLLWDEVLLSASELDDCGHAEVSVRVRAMPRRWFALLRCFVRVDGVLVRLYETRVVANFFDDEGLNRVVDVLRETRHSEGEFKDLAAAGAPGTGGGGGTGRTGSGAFPSSAAAAAAAHGAYADADSAAAALSAVAPIGVTRFVTERLFVV